MTIAAILFTATIACLAGYNRGHAAALAVPYGMLADRLDEITQERESTQRKIWGESQ